MCLKPMLVDNPACAAASCVFSVHTRCCMWPSLCRLITGGGCAVGAGGGGAVVGEPPVGTAAEWPSGSFRTAGLPGEHAHQRQGSPHGFWT